MGYINDTQNYTSQQSSSSSKGPKGDTGIGFKLDSNNDYDIQNKRCVNYQRLY